MKFLQQVEFQDHSNQSKEKDKDANISSSYRLKISSVFADIHLSVINASTKMLNENRRHNYVTPTNYLELVKGLYLT